MPTKTKELLVKEIVAIKGNIVGNRIAEAAFIDLIIPLSGEGKIKSISDDGNITIEFSAPIETYLVCQTKRNLQKIIRMIDAATKEVNKI